MLPRGPALEGHPEFSEKVGQHSESRMALNNSRPSKKLPWETGSWLPGSTTTAKTNSWGHTPKSMTNPSFLHNRNWPGKVFIPLTKKKKKKNLIPKRVLWLHTVSGEPIFWWLYANGWRKKSWTLTRQISHKVSNRLFYAMQKKILPKRNKEH